MAKDKGKNEYFGIFEISSSKILHKFIVQVKNYKLRNLLNEWLTLFYISLSFVYHKKPSVPTQYLQLRQLTRALNDM